MRSWSVPGPSGMLTCIGLARLWTPWCKNARHRHKHTLINSNLSKLAGALNLHNQIFLHRKYTQCKSVVAFHGCHCNYGQEVGFPGLHHCQETCIYKVHKVHILSLKTNIFWEQITIFVHFFQIAHLNLFLIQVCAQTESNFDSCFGSYKLSWFVTAFPRGFKEYATEHTDMIQYSLHTLWILFKLQAERSGKLSQNPTLKTVCTVGQVLLLLCAGYPHQRRHTCTVGLSSHNGIRVTSSLEQASAGSS